jgi:hypothetical protein
MKTSEDFSQNAGIIDVVDENTIYYCYPELGVTSEAEAKWSICRAKKTGTAWHYQWANGKLEKTFKASERTALNYSYVK